MLVELVWALARSYDRPRGEIVTVMRALAGNATVRPESATCIREATALYQHGPADFVGCLVAAKAQALGCAALRSFDKKMNGLPGVALL